MEAYAAFDADVKLLPQWVQIWMDILGLVLVVSTVCLLVGKQTRAVGLYMLISTVAIVTIMVSMHAQLGMVRLLGVVHIVFWTPLVLYLWQRLKTNPPPRAISGRRHDSPDDCLLSRADLRLLRCHPLDFGPAGARRLTQVLFFWRVARNGFAAKGRMTAHILWWKAGLIAQHFSSMPGPARIV